MLLLFKLKCLIYGFLLRIKHSRTRSAAVPQPSSERPAWLPSLNLINKWATMIAACRLCSSIRGGVGGVGDCNNCYVYIWGEIHRDRFETHFLSPAAYKTWRLSKSTLEVGRRSEYASKCTTVLEKWVMHNMPHLFLWTQIFSFRILKVLLELCYQLIVIPDHIRVPHKCFPLFFNI